jgi:hypothetical protein
MRQQQYAVGLDAAAIVLAHQLWQEMGMPASTSAVLEDVIDGMQHADDEAASSCVA